jgi:hypothetical protein
MAGPASIYVQDHVFFLTDRDVTSPFETMDHSTGMAGVMGSAALINTGINRGYVAVSTQPVDHEPELNTAEQWAGLASWEDVVEVSLWVPNGTLTVEQLEYRPFAARPQVPVLSPHGPGHYRLRIHASGRDRHYDEVIDQSGERYHIVAWPARPAGPLLVKALSWCGYSIRVGELHHPHSTEPIQPTPHEQAEGEHQARLRRQLLEQSGESRPTG